MNRGGKLRLTNQPAGLGDATSILRESRGSDRSSRPLLRIREPVRLLLPSVIPIRSAAAFCEPVLPASGTPRPTHTVTGGQ